MTGLSNGRAVSLQRHRALQGKTPGAGPAVLAQRPRLAHQYRRSPSHAAPTRPRTVDSPAYGLRQALDATAPPGPRVVADMSGVSFMDSTGINIVITVHRDLAEAGGLLRLAAPTGPVLHTIRLVGIDTVIDCHDTLRQGLST
ncbi:STAS domain-containing protein [Streptomyces sp. NBC_00299]|uniref:STAS domain-containing protein n=1 Tax=Streptomyces sp. NBC_00299 TaxID=2975705 RepID=UPI002E2A0ED8|nr:STAS domain-containing protein [Streptomyces sp. NBC_00299]